MELIFPRLILEERPPLSSDDSSKGYLIGQNWLDIKTSKYYVCTKTTSLAAEWFQVLTPSDLSSCCQRLANIEEILAGMLDEMSNGDRLDFTANVTTGSSPFSVQFTCTNNSDITGYSWTFGDGGISAQSSPNYVYNTNGIYTVTLIGTKSDGSKVTVTKRNLITVAPQLNASFTSNTSYGLLPLTVVFDSSTSTGDITSYLWLFGDGTNSTEPNPTKIYSTAGKYSVSLTVSDGTKTHSVTKSNYVIASPTSTVPVADFNCDVSTGIVPFDVKFSTNSSGSITSYLWNFGDDVTSTNPNPTHTYSNPGYYNVSLTVSGPSGSNTKTKTNYISANNAEETLDAEFGSNTFSGNIPLAIQFTNSSIGSHLSYLWDFGDGTTSTLAAPLKIYNTAGTYTVKLTITDTLTNNTDTEIKNNYVVATSSNFVVSDFTVDKTSGNNPLVVNFTNASIGSNLVYTWDFGDGITSTEINPNHTYTNIGTYTVKLTAKDTSTNISDIITKSNLITVSAGSTPTVNADFIVDKTSGSIPLAVNFTNASIGSNLVYTWDFGDGITSTEINPNHIYTSIGTYTVKLTAQDTVNIITDIETKSNLITVSAGSTDSQIITPDLKVFDSVITNWDAGTWTMPTGWSGVKSNSDTAFQITHGLNTVPTNYIIYNNESTSFIPKSSTRTLSLDSNNMCTFTQCQVSNQFTCRLLFPKTYGGTNGNEVLIHRMSIADWTNSVWTLPVGWSGTKSGNSLLLTHNLNKNPIFWECTSYTPNSINNLFITGTSSIKVTFPSTMVSTFNVDIYFIK